MTIPIGETSWVVTIPPHVRIDVSGYVATDC